METAHLTIICAGKSLASKLVDKSKTTSHKSESFVNDTPDKPRSKSPMKLEKSPKRAKETSPRVKKDSPIQVRA